MLNVLSLFSGIGAFEKALERERIPFNLLNYCEIDKYASKSFSAVHNVSEEKNLVDVTKIDTSKLQNVDLVTYGFPCVPKGYLIKVIDGYKNIEDITNDDLVLTHNNQYKQVVKTMNRISDHINHIELVGCQDLQVTDEHPLYVLRNNEFLWVQAKDLNKDTDYLCYNINDKSVSCEYDNNVLWLLGRYFADGYKENHSLHRTIFCIGRHKIKDFEKHIQGFKYSKNHNNRTAVEYKITDEYLCNIFKSFPIGSSLKHIPQWIIDLPKDQLEVFYQGYFSGNGHKRNDRNLFMFSTVSKIMFYNLQDIIIKLYNVVPSMNIRHDNRKVTFSDTYNAQYSLSPKNQIVKDNKICVKIKDVIREISNIEVFNFEVKDDNSYTVNNVIVHNCQDISTAGKQKGFVDEHGNSTRSGLFFEALRIIKDIKPKYAIAENVKALTSKKFTSEFQTVLTSLNNVGYNNYYKVLNAKDYGIPQNRERIFIISIRKDIDDGFFVFPNPVPLRMRLKDLIETNVDERYYLTDDQVKRITTSNYMQNKRRIQEKDISDTLCARDWKDPKCVKIVNSDISKTVRTGGHGSLDKHSWDLVQVNEPTCGASRGRNPNNPSDRSVGTHYEQRLELNRNGTCNTLTTVQKDNLIVEPKIIQVMRAAKERNFTNPQSGRVYNPDGLSPCLSTMQGGGLEPKIIEANVGVNPLSKKREFNGFHTECSPCLLATDYKAPKCTLTNSFRIRKLTPLECWRLMGFDDDDFYKAQNAGISNSQLYKQAGNSIVVNVLQAIFRQFNFEKVS